MLEKKPVAIDKDKEYSISFEQRDVRKPFKPGTGNSEPIAQASIKAIRHVKAIMAIVKLLIRNMV
jgi:hypothetical protein